MFAACAHAAAADYAEGHFGQPSHPAAYGAWLDAYHACSTEVDSFVSPLEVGGKNCAPAFTTAKVRKPEVDVRTGAELEAAAKREHEALARSEAKATEALFKKEAAEALDKTQKEEALIKEQAEEILALKEAAEASENELYALQMYKDTVEMKKAWMALTPKQRCTSPYKRDYNYNGHYYNYEGTKKYCESLGAGWGIHTFTNQEERNRNEAYESDYSFADLKVNENNEFVWADGRLSDKPLKWRAGRPPTAEVLKKKACFMYYFGGSIEPYDCKDRIPRACSRCVGPDGEAT